MTLQIEMTADRQNALINRMKTELSEAILGNFLLETVVLELDAALSKANEEISSLNGKIKELEAKIVDIGNEALPDKD